MLRRHIRTSKWFQMFVVIVILLLCAFIILLATKFPAAVAPTDEPPTANESAADTGHAETAS